MDSSNLMTFLFPVLMLGMVYFFFIRPQNQRQKAHQLMLSNLKRNEMVVLSSGMIGKVTRIEDAEVMIEVASGINVRVVKAMIAEVRTKGTPQVANDTKS